MSRNHEKLLVAILAGLIIAGAAAFAINPAIASTSDPVRLTDLNASAASPLLLAKG